MIIHQAIYGDLDGAYALLDTSLKDEDIARRICNVTDIIDRPLSRELAQPIIRGFRYNDHFLFIKSFPDNTNENIRRGRVLSHTLIIELEELNELDNLEELFSYFPDNIYKKSTLKPITIQNKAFTRTINNNTREVTVINSLLHENDKVVWLGEEGYFRFLFIIWNSLPKQLRASLRVGVGFSPNKIDLKNNSTNILYIYDGYENKWEVEGYRIVKVSDVETLKTQSSFLLAGRKEKAHKMLQFMTSFQLEPKAIHDVAYIENNITFYEDLSIDTEFNTLLVLSNFISELSPNPSLAITEKRKLFDLIISKIEKATPENIIALNNVKWTGFKNSEKELQTIVHDWSKTNLLIIAKDSRRSNVVFKSLQSDQKNGWWGNAICNGISATLSDWKGNYGPILFSWFIDNPNLVSLLEKYIPNISEVEDSLVACWTSSTPHKVAAPLRGLAKRREWFSLFGLTSLRLFDPEESIKMLLELDTNPSHLVALSKTSEYINIDHFIELTLNLGEDRLIKIAGQKIARNPPSLAELDVTNSIWIRIWLVAIKSGANPWQSVKNPIKRLHSLFEQIVCGVEFHPDLLKELSTDNNNDLSEFEQRKDVWSHLKGNIKSNFLEATTIGCVNLYNDDKIDIADLEGEVLKQIADFEFFKNIIKNTSLSVSKKIHLFKSISGLEERSFISLITKCTFSPTESKNIGLLIKNRDWKSAANYISKQQYTRKDLEPAYAECQSLMASEGGFYSTPFSWFFPKKEPTKPFTINKGATLEMPKGTRILLLATNPKDTNSLRLDEEFREIEESINIGKNSSYFEIAKAGALRTKDLRRQILNTKPNIIHFSGHASPNGIALENESGNCRLISGKKLANLFKLSENLGCVILNACFSESQAREIAQYIPYVIGMKVSIGDKAAIEFSKGFYDALSSGEDVPIAFEYGKSAIEMEGINEKETPVLIKLENE